MAVGRSQEGCSLPVRGVGWVRSGGAKTHLRGPEHSDSATADSKATKSTSGLGGRRSEVRKLNMSEGERILQ